MVLNATLRLNDDEGGSVVDASQSELLHRIEAAILIARSPRFRASYDADAVAMLDANLSTLSETVQSGVMPRPSRGEIPPSVGNFLTRFVGEWCSDEKMTASLAAIETFYKEQF
ncbi:MAG: hypothetical protein JSS55_17230 [Proteobacteria bacterium]|nr:hypothetical protein [Pseudomonadota bacterium]